MALYVVGLNHGLNVDPKHDPVTIGDVKYLAQVLRSSWTGDPGKLIVAISDTGGCPNCGLALTNSATILRDELGRVYDSKFDVRVALPEPITQYTSMPAVVVGANWAMDALPFKQELPAPPLTFKGLIPRKNHYGHVVLRSVGPPTGSVDLFITHDWLADEGDPPDGPSRNFDHLMSEARANASATTVAMIVGDFNVPLSTDGVKWIESLRGDSYWSTTFNDCSYTTGNGTKSTAMYNDIMNIVEFSHADTTSRLRPFAYAYDAEADGTPMYPNEAMKAGNIKHAVIGVLFRFEPNTTPTQCADDQCRTAACPCLPKCGGKCGGAGDGCGRTCSGECASGWDCRNKQCQQVNPDCLRACVEELNGCNEDCKARPSSGCFGRCRDAATQCRARC